MWQNDIRFVTQNTEPNSVLLPDGLLYSQKILSTFSDVYALYPLNETGVTTTALEIINGYNGAYNGPTLGAIAGPGPSMGNAGFYDGVVDYCQLPAASLDGPFDPSLGTMMIWLKVANAGVWTDGENRYLLNIGVDGSNRIYLLKSSVANTLVYGFSSGGFETRSVAFSSTEWFCCGITWNLASNRVRAYLNGVQQGADLTYPGVWAGSLTSNYTVIGTSLGSQFMHGYPSFLVLSSAEATAAQMLAGAIAV